MRVGERMAKREIPGARHLSAKAKKIWKENTSEDNLPHFRQVCFNMVHEYCFFVCRESSCEACKVSSLRSWMSSLKALPQNLKIPLVRELDVVALSVAEDNSPGIEVEEGVDGTEAD